MKFKRLFLQKSPKISFIHWFCCCVAMYSDVCFKNVDCNSFIFLACSLRMSNHYSQPSSRHEFVFQRLAAAVELQIFIWHDLSKAMTNQSKITIYRVAKQVLFQTTNVETSERPMNRHRHQYRPNLEVRQGLAEPPNLQVRSAEPRPNQFTK